MDQDTPSSPDKDKAPDTNQGGLGGFWGELKRRKVVRVAVTYAIVGWLVIQIAATTFPSLYIPPWALSFVIMCVILGFPVSLILAWAFELTPEGIKTTKAAQKTGANKQVDSSHAKKRNWISIVFAVAVPTLIFGTLALFFYIRSGSGPDFSDEDRSIAVLPFDNRSNLDEDQFFTDGIHDDLLTQISRIPNLKTIARTSVMVYRGTTKDMRTIGEELGVRTILEGGVQRSGDRIRINAQLIDAETNAHLWSENYTREMTAGDVFEIQDEITRTIAKALKLMLSSQDIKQLEKTPTENLEALEAYFRSKEYLKANASDLEKSIAYCEQAISLDPDFSLAHAILGRRLLTQTVVINVPRAKNRAKAEFHILKALELDDTLSEAYSALGVLRRQQGDLVSSQEAHKKSIELNPNNAEAYHDYYRFFDVTGGDGAEKEMVRLLQKSYQLDPKHQNANNRLARSLQILGQLDEAQKIWENEATNHPSSADDQKNLGVFYFDYRDRFDNAIMAYRNAISLNQNAPAYYLRLSGSYLRLGDTKQAIWWIDKFLEIQQDPLLQAKYKTRKFKIEENKVTRERVSLEGLAQFPQEVEFLHELTDLYIASDQPEKILFQWKLVYPTLFNPSPEVDSNNYWIAKDVARVLKATGEMEQAKHLIRETLVTVKSISNRSALQIEGCLHAITGDDQQALNAIRSFFDAGGSPYYLMLEDELKRFEDHPEYVAMAEKRKAELAIQLKRIRKMDAAGELAEIPEHLRD